ncbi:MAG: HAD-IA family hydrolase [Ruminococcus sp.]|nr:HAD-IA family hydrolase [Ruminococcus sp.]
MLKMVVFDLDGTLVDSLTDLALNVNKGLKEAGLPEHPVESYKQFIGNGREVMIKKAMGDSSDNEALFNIARDVFDKEYAVHCNDNTQEYAGCTALLNALAQKNIFTGILSNKPDEFVGMIAQKVFPTHSFTEAWGQKTEYKRKPDGEALLAMLKKHAVKASECLYIGDSDVDVFTAKNACVPMVGVSWGFRGKEELMQAGAEYVADNAEELLSYILKQLQEA